MPFKPSLVALPVDPTAFPYLGYPLTEIVLEQENGEGAALPSLPTPDSRDKIIEAVTGSDVRVNRRKLADVEFDIDYISAAKKAEIERLYHDARSIYLSPNFGPDTMWSFPLQRSTDDFSGNKTMSTIRTCENHEWDAIDKVFRSFDDNKPSLVFHGAWSRYFKSRSAYRNYATKPHPDSASTGWAIGSGSPVISYTEDIKTPLLSNRGVTNAEGVTLVTAPSGASLSTIIHISTASLLTTRSIGCCFPMAWKGLVAVSLQDVGGAAVYDSAALTGDGTFQLIRLSGLNSNASNDAEIKIYFSDTTTENQLAMIGPVSIGNAGSTGIGQFPDWSDGTARLNDLTSETDTIDNIFAEASFSFFFQWSEINNGLVHWGSTPHIKIIKWEIGSIVVGVTAGSKAFASVDSQFGISKGDWVHCVVTLGVNGINLYINGQAHSANGTYQFDPEHYDHSLVLGYYGGYTLDDSGMSHVRADRKEWTASEVIDHYDTYFKDFGRGVIEPVYGKEMIIDEMEWVPRAGGNSDQWLGRIILRELGVEEDFAPMQRQEDM